MAVARVDRLQLPGILCIVIGLVLAIGSASSLGFGAMHMYFFGVMYWTVTTLGFFGLVLLHQMLEARWGHGVLRLAQAGGGWRSLVLVGISLIPILISPQTFYPWADSKLVAEDAILQHRAFLMNPGFFGVVTVLLIGVFAAIAWCNETWLVRQEQTGDLSWKQKRRHLSGVAFFIYVIGITLLYTLWLMSLEKHWYSSIYPVWIGVGSVLGALGFVTAIVGSQAGRDPYASFLSPQLRKDYGNLLLAVTLFWTYITFSQFLIIWSGNLSEFSSFYLNRTGGYWEPLLLAVVLGQFFVPFMLLLSPPTKRHFSLLAGVGGLIAVMRIPDFYYVVVGSFPEQYRVAAFIPGAIGGLLAIGGIWLVVFGQNVKKYNLLPTEENPHEVAHHA